MPYIIIAILTAYLYMSPYKLTTFATDVERKVSHVVDQEQRIRQLQLQEDIRNARTTR